VGRSCNKRTGTVPISEPIRKTLRNRLYAFPGLVIVARWKLDKEAVKLPSRLHATRGRGLSKCHAKPDSWSELWGSGTLSSVVVVEDEDKIPVIPRLMALAVALL
jgi:hypothetical protein